jgi:uncharacterized 2Fe-2S/4Fe-4S cluster protein (DUF4445 family)
VLATTTEDNREIVITRKDIDYFIRSKGALYAGYNRLLKIAGKNETDINTFYIAGALGSMINIENGITIGLFPDIPEDKFKFLGNSSLIGSWMLLLSSEARRLAEDIARKAIYVELSLDAEYMNEYTSSLFLPHTDIDRFTRILEKIRNI